MHTENVLGTRRARAPAAQFTLLKHAGGGGVFGVEALDGRAYDSVVYAQSEPRQCAALPHPADRSGSRICSVIFRN